MLEWEIHRIRKRGTSLRFGGRHSRLALGHILASLRCSLAHSSLRSSGFLLRAALLVLPLLSQRQDPSGDIASRVSLADRIGL